jgi:ATP-dependent RNA helicase DeaD
VAAWGPPPSPEDIRARDQDRLVAQLTPSEPATEEDLAVARRLLTEGDPEQVVAALVRARRAALPAPEDLVDGSPEPAPTTRDAPRAGFEDSAWFSIDLGRNRNAEARWILPLICRRGHITRSEIGAIRVFDLETRFEIAGPAVARFTAALAKTQDESARIEPLADPELPARRDRRGGPKPKFTGKRSEPAGKEPSPKASAKPPHTSHKQLGKLRKPKPKQKGR